MSAASTGRSSRNGGSRKNTVPNFSVYKDNPDKYRGMLAAELQAYRNKIDEELRAIELAREPSERLSKKMCFYDMELRVQHSALQIEKTIIKQSDILLPLFDFLLDAERVDPADIKKLATVPCVADYVVSNLKIWHRKIKNTPWMVRLKRVDSEAARLEEEIASLKNVVDEREKYSSTLDLLVSNADFFEKSTEQATRQRFQSITGFLPSLKVEQEKVKEEIIQTELPSPLKDKTTTTSPRGKDEAELSEAETDYDDEEDLDLFGFGFL